MLPGKGVLLLQVEGEGQFQANPDQTRIDHQHLPEGRDCFVEQLVPLVFVLGNRRGLDRGYAPLEQGGEVRRRLLVVRGRDRGGGEREKKDQGGGENAHRGSPHGMGKERVNSFSPRMRQ